MEITVFRERGGSIVFYKAALLINWKCQTICLSLHFKTFASVRELSIQKAFLLVFNMLEDELQWAE
jgi:hypothetical protein